MDVEPPVPVSETRSAPFGANVAANVPAPTAAFSVICDSLPSA